MKTRIAMLIVGIMIGSASVLLMTPVPKERETLRNVGLMCGELLKTRELVRGTIYERLVYTQVTDDCLLVMKEAGEACTQ